MRGKQSCCTLLHRHFCENNHFLFLRKWLLTHYWLMFATISEPFFSLFPWQQHDMSSASERERETNPDFFFHCTKKPSRPSPAFFPPHKHTAPQQNATSFSATWICSATHPKGWSYKKNEITRIYVFSCTSMLSHFCVINLPLQSQQLLLQRGRR